MLIYPDIDPVAFAIGPIAVRWYGLMYFIAFAQFWWLGRRRIRFQSQLGHNDLSFGKLEDLLFYGILGLIVGARLGEALFYSPGYYFSYPLRIFMVWEGGMSFHGGFLGVLITVGWFSRKTQLSYLTITDFAAPLIPLGLAAGRIGNFINGELWGRVCGLSLPWCMVFKHVDDLPRHPSQLYQAFLEGFLLFIILWLFSGKPRQRGTVSGVFLVGYGTFRFIVEFFRAPDEGIFGKSYAISMGQWLSIPMILAGAAILIWALKKSNQRP